jgi:hypothetical protein
MRPRVTGIQKHFKNMVDILLESGDRNQNGGHTRNKELNGFEGVVVHPDEPEDAIQVTDELTVIEHHGVDGVTAHRMFVIDHAHRILAEFDDFNYIIGMRTTVALTAAQEPQLNRAMARHLLFVPSDHL